MTRLILALAAATTALAQVPSVAANPVARTGQLTTFANIMPGHLTGKVALTADATSRLFVTPSHPGIALDPAAIAKALSGGAFVPPEISAPATIRYHVAPKLNFSLPAGDVALQAAPSAQCPVLSPCAGSLDLYQSW